MNTTVAVSFTVAIASVSCAAPSNRSQSANVGSDYVLTSVVEAYDPDIVNDSLAFSHINAIGLHADTIAIADGGDRIVFLNNHLEFIRATGRSGAGPGEFNGPWHVQFWDGGWVVSDMGNARLTFFDSTGGVAREIAAPGGRGPEVVLTSSGEVVIPLAADSTYARRWSDGSWEPWAYRVTPLADLASQRGASLIHDWLCLTSGDTLHVLDARTLELLKYAPDGTLVMHRYIREDLRSLLLEGSGVREELFGSQPTLAYRPAAREMIRGPEDEIWISVPPPLAMPDLFALVVDPHSYEVRVVHAGVASKSPGSPATRLVLAVDRRYVVTAEMEGKIRVYAYGPQDR